MPKINSKLKTKKSKLKPVKKKLAKKPTKPARAGKKSIKAAKKIQAAAQAKTITNIKTKIDHPKKPEIVPQSELVKKYQSHKGDTGSTGVQIAILSDRIQELVKHLRKHAKDFDSKRGLLILVGKRRRLLNYLKNQNLKIYETMIAELGLRK